MTGIVIVLLIMQVICVFVIYVQAEHTKSVEKTLWHSVNRIGNECDSLRARVWKLKHKEGAQE